MKSIFNISKGFLSVAILSAAFVSCSEDKMDSINNDNNHTTVVPSKFILADVLTSTAFNNVGGDFNTYFASYVEHEVGISNQLYRAETRTGEPSSSTTFNNVWENTYSVLKNARIIVHKCSEDGDQHGNYTTRGIGEVMVALNSGLIADAFGDTPYTQAALPELTNGQPTYMNPILDTQESIYRNILQSLDNAIADLPQGDNHISGGVGNYDLLFKGDTIMWRKFAYGLKARYTMHMIHRSTDVEGDLRKILSYIDRSFQDGEEAAYDMYDGINLNPLFDFQWSRDYLAASKSMATKLVERNDPRMRRVFVTPMDVRATKPPLWTQISGKNDPGFDNTAPNGTPLPLQYHYNTSIYVFAETAPTLLLSAHELLFLKAEALCRLNRTDNAEGVLKQAIVTAIANTERSVNSALTEAPDVLSNGGIVKTSDAITTEEAEDYFDNEVKALFDANPLKETMIQKYIAFWGASGESTECYNDIRRMKAMGEDFVTLENPNPFPLRCPYGDGDVNANPNVEAAFGNGQYVYTDPVWWAGGSR